MQGSFQQPTCELPCSSTRGSFCLQTICRSPSWENPSDAPSRFYSVSKWRQVEVDRLLERLSKNARASLQRLREKQEIPSNIVTESSEPPEETKVVFDKRNAPIPNQESSKDVTREKDTAIPPKKIDSKCVDVVKERTRTEAELHVLPTHLPGFVTDVPKMRMNRKGTTQSKMKDICSSASTKGRLIWNLTY